MYLFLRRKIIHLFRVICFFRLKNAPFSYPALRFGIFISRLWLSSRFVEKIRGALLRFPGPKTPLTSPTLLLFETRTGNGQATGNLWQSPKTKGTIHFSPKKPTPPYSPRPKKGAPL
ncbi:MAG: hypothetical protein D6714_06780 [Bacteroidetes bacterium]|nr:MAG: hypothetical protein D6714_06780 [Bacteroidota bacterium]